MGNTESNVTSGVKKQAGTSEQPLYKLVDLKGGGLLVDMMKRAAQSKQYAELDHAIKTKVEPFLYNKGKGRLIPISQLVLLRNCERSRTKLLPPLKNMEDPESEFDLDSDGNPGDFKAAADDEIDDFHDLNKKYRDVCWDLKKRGAVGETCLHLCMLNATSIHADLAKRLLRFYPKLINDIYMCDEYYGENVLHVAIVNEDPAMVKYLLDSGANFHERCVGNFMCPEDQKGTRTDSMDHEYVNLSPETNYDGYVYWGEYPLSFAACLGQEECYRLMLARGANPNNQDTNGNSVLHMLVIHNKLSTFDMAYEVGADISLINVKCLTPLTLSAKLAHVEMFFHILNIEREIYWQIGSITCAAYPLSQIDTIDNESGNISKNSALNLVVFGDKDEHLELMDGVLVDLLVAKWNAYVKFRFYRQFISFFFYFLISLVCFTLRPGPPANLPVASEGTNATTNGTNTIVDAGNLTSLPDPIKELKSESLKSAELIHNLSFIINNTKYEKSPLMALIRVNATIPLKENLLVTNLTNEIMSNNSVNGTKDEGGRCGNGCKINEVGDIKGSNDNNQEEARRMASLSPHKANRSKRQLELAEEIEAFPAVSPTSFYGKISESPDLNSSKSKDEVEDLICPLLEIDTFEAKVRVAAEVAMMIGAILYILAALREARFLGIHMFIENLSTAPSRVMFLGSCCFMLVVPWLRFTCNTELEDIVAVIIMLTTSPYFLFFCRGFKTVGPFVVMIYRMIMGDLLRFVCIYTVFVMGFSQAYYVIFLSYDNPSTPDGVDDTVSNPMSNPVESIMAMFLISLSNFGDYYTAFEKTEHEMVSKAMFVIYMVIVAILLVNMLIAMMGNTYQKIAETRNEWQRQWARIVLVVERGVSPSERLRNLMVYSQPMSDGRRALVLRLHQTPDDKEEMKDILDMKRVHKRMVERRKAKGQKNAAFISETTKHGATHRKTGPIPPLKSIPRKAPDPS